MNIALRLLRLAGHLIVGSLTILLRFPYLSAEQRGQQVTQWARKLLAIFGVRATVIGHLPGVRSGGALIVANHVSWLDIYLLHSLLYTRFISKAEVRGWPLVGWLADRTGTLFLERARKSDAARVNGEMADHLRSGECLTLFPEGTTTDGTELRPFYASLFKPALDAGATVWPVAIRYLDRHGQPTTAAAYHGDTSLLQSALAILRQRGIRAEVTFLPPIPARDMHRRDLAQAAEARIREALNTRPPEAAGHTPAVH